MRFLDCMRDGGFEALFQKIDEGIGVNIRRNGIGASPTRLARGVYGQE